MKPTLFVSWLFVFVFFSANSYSQNYDLKKVKENLIKDALVNQGYAPRIERYITSDYSKTGKYLETMNPDGSWSDVDYSDRDNDWHPLHHLDRLLVMSYNYMKDTSSFFQKPEVLAGLERSIRYWYTVNPECDNWYKNKIAKQFYFNVIAILLDGKIDAELQAKMVNDLTPVPTMTGSNRTLLATSTFYRGVLENDPEMTMLGVTGVTDQILVTTKEGVQPDYSFHQHGKFIYNGSYGLNYLRESIWLATIVHGTAFAFSPEEIKILRDYYLNGTRWMIRGGLIDYNVRGRQVGRGDAIKLYGDLLIPILDHMIIADPEYAGEYKVSSRNIKDQKPQVTKGNKHFWRSDYTIHHKKNYSTSLKMCSERTVGIELNMNSENKMGRWLPYGLTYIYQKGDEYNAIFPVWNWARLPGVTNPYVEQEEKEKSAKYSQKTNFVGGVSNGNLGISVMDFYQEKTKAKKAWFWFEEEWVALGTGIESQHDAPVVTGIEQCLLSDEVYVDGKPFVKKEHNLEDPAFVFHNHVGYIFPDNNAVQLKSTTQTGNMQRIYGLGKDTVYSQEVFSLWINHGTKPQNAGYSYIAVPGMDNKSFKRYIEKIPIKILSNTTKIQAVENSNLQTIGVVFHEAGEFKSGRFTITVDQPCLLLWNTAKKEFALSDPTAGLKNIQVHISSEDRKIFEERVQLPEDGFAGKSVLCAIK